MYEESDGTAAKAALGFAVHRTFKILNATLFNNNKEVIHVLFLDLPRLLYKRKKTAYNLILKHINASRLLFVG